MDKKGQMIAVRPDLLIEARFELNQKQNDILDMVFSQIDDDENYRYEINIEKYKRLYNSDVSNIYRDLKKAAKSFEGKGFRIVNHDTKQEDFFVWFSRISYKDKEGKIIVNIDKDLKQIFIEMKKRIYYHIKYPLNFKSVYSKRIYYFLKSFESTGWRIDALEDLKIKLCCESNYKEYKNFKRKVLVPSQEEINTCSDISFDFEEIKTGRKVTSLKFFIKNTVVHTEQEEQLSLLEDPTPNKEVKAIFQEEISELEIKKVLDAAKGNLEVIREKYEMAKKSKRIKNIVAWMIRAIKEDYKKPKEKVKADNFNNFEQRSYDFEDLERKLLGWDNKKSKKKDSAS